LALVLVNKNLPFFVVAFLATRVRQGLFQGKFKLAERLSLMNRFDSAFIFARFISIPF